MPENVIQQIQRISSGLDKILDRNRSMEKDLKKFKSENETLKKTESDLKEEIRLLKEQLFILKASAEPLNENDKKEFEKTINQYLSTIDKCIAMLKN